MRSIWLLLTMVLISCCSHSSNSQQIEIVGTWQLTRIEPFSGGTIIPHYGIIIHINADNTCTFDKSTDTVQWSISQDTLVICKAKSDKGDFFHNGSYRIKFHKGELTIKNNPDSCTEIYRKINLLTVPVPVSTHGTRKNINFASRNNE